MFYANVNRIYVSVSESENQVVSLSPVRQSKSVAEKKTNETNIVKTIAAKTIAAKTIAAKTIAAKTIAAKTNAAKTNAAKTNAANTAAVKPSTAKATSRPLTDVAKTVFSKLFKPQKDGVETNSRFKQPLGIKPLSPLRNMNHLLPAQMSPSVSSHQMVAASPGSKRRLFVDNNTGSLTKKPMTTQEPSMEKNVSRVMLKKSFEIMETVVRVEQKLDRLLAVQNNQHIEDLFEEIMKLPVNDRESWLMLEDLLVEKRSGIKLVSG